MRLLRKRRFQNFSLIETPEKRLKNSKVFKHVKKMSERSKIRKDQKKNKRRVFAAESANNPQIHKMAS